MPPIYISIQVKWWLTFNEPFVFCWVGHGVGAHAPGIQQPATGGYNCAHTVIKSHARAYHTYNDKFRSTQKGTTYSEQTTTKYCMNGKLMVI